MPIADLLILVSVKKRRLGCWRKYGLRFAQGPVGLLRAHNRAMAFLGKAYADKIDCIQTQDLLRLTNKGNNRYGDEGKVNPRCHIYPNAVRRRFCRASAAAALQDIPKFNSQY